MTGGVWGGVGEEGWTNPLSTRKGTESRQIYVSQGNSSNPCPVGRAALKSPSVPRAGAWCMYFPQLAPTSSNVASRLFTFLYPTVVAADSDDNTALTLLSLFKHPLGVKKRGKGDIAPPDKPPMVLLGPKRALSIPADGSRRWICAYPPLFISRPLDDRVATVWFQRNPCPQRILSRREYRLMMFCGGAFRFFARRGCYRWKVSFTSWMVSVLFII